VAIAYSGHNSRTAKWRSYLLGATEAGNALMQRRPWQLMVLRHVRLIVRHTVDWLLMDSHGSSISKNTDDAKNGHAHHQ
jgi:hypothetical protein